MSAHEISRRRVLGAGLGAAAAVAVTGALGTAAAHAATGTAVPPGAPGTGAAPADLVLRNGRITTMDPRRSQATAIAIRGETVLAVGGEDDVRAHIGPRTRVLDLRGRRVVPGLNDSHTHLAREGLSYTNELSLAGVRSVADALRLIRYQADRTPAPQWVRVVGGFSQFQFAEQRLPTLAELNAAVPDKPVFLLHLYDRALLNRAALRVLGFDKLTPDLPGSQIERDAAGNPTGLLVAKPNANILYGTLAKLPTLDPATRVTSTRHYLRHLNARGVTSVVDAGGGGQRYPEDYSVLHQLHDAGQLTVRTAFHAFTQQPGGELADYRRIAGLAKPGDGDDYLRLVGAGEMIVWSGGDFETFFQPRPDLPAVMDGQLADVLGFFADRRWPFRLHATYDESITRFLDVIERVYTTGIPFVLDHAETISPRNVDRVAALGGGIAIQHRLAFQGEEFVKRYGAAAARRALPVHRIQRAGIPLGLGTDATRVASDNVWQALHWLSTGQTVGGHGVLGPGSRVSREEALRLMTVGSAWFSGDQDRKGTLAPGRLADLAVLSEDFLTVAAPRIPAITSVLTVVGGRIVYAAAEHAAFDPAPPPVEPAYSPLRTGANRPA
ncbi:putative amidohydrolase YtcJ [Crossiella equi]|uniref:Amidohydrolase YtcJ n=1 Tax=Crossiella equi TaxID=130796 RepID=A0ABS5AKK7_9PSEU|nr:amidohydrolase [Crossiella equi]MBP2477110.1 putative amidohydrolase YtcJ [Crossiella equi]